MRVDPHGQARSPYRAARGDLPSEHGEREGEARLPDGQAPSGFAGGGGDASPYNRQGEAE